jgi:PPOX class probable F420-dependent enzyme
MNFPERRGYAGRSAPALWARVRASGTHGGGRMELVGSRHVQRAGSIGAKESAKALSSVNPAMGHGVNQRQLIKMTPAEVDAMLHERRPMTMCTIRHDGSIHAVAMWYGFLDGAPAIETKSKSQKAQNLRRDPRMTCLVEDGDSYEELRGVELVGRAEFVDDPERMWRLGVSLFERYYGEYNDELQPMIEAMLHKRVVVRLVVERVVSWDHRKLGLAPA